MANLRVSRVRTIMKTAEGVDSVAKDAVWLVTRASELFIKKIVSEAYETSNKSKKLTYDHLINVVFKESEYEFLQIMIPKKITVKEYREMMARKERATQSSPDDVSEANAPSVSKKK